MGQRILFSGVVGAALLFAAAALFPAASGQQQPNCVGSLLNCSSSFLNGTKPSKECCDALKETAEKQLPCLCSIFTNPAVLSSFNATTETAIQFSVTCGLKAGPSMCKPAAALPPALEAPPPTPGSHKGDKGAASKIAGTGLTALFFAVVSFVLN